MKSISKVLSICTLICTLFIMSSVIVSADPGTIVTPTITSIKPPVTISESIVDVSANPGTIVTPTTTSIKPPLN